MLKKKMICGGLLIVSIISVLFLGCSEKSESEYVSGEPLFVNNEIDFVKQDHIIYFVANSGSSAQLRYLDVLTGECMPLCGRPECLHDKPDCNAHISPRSAVRLTLYRDRLYWIEGTRSASALYSVKTDGTDREKVIDLDSGLYSMASGAGTADIRNDVLYVCGASQTVVEGVPLITGVVFSQSLDGGEAKLLYSSEPNTRVFGRVSDNTLYFAQTDERDPDNDDENKQLSTKLFAYNVNTFELKELYHDKRPNTAYRYLLVDNDMLYLGGYYNAAVYSVRDGSFSVFGSDNKQMDVGNDLILHWDSRYSFSCANFSNELLFECTYPPDGIDMQPSGRLFIGTSCKKAYYYACFTPDDWSSERWYIIEIDLENHTSSALWYHDIVFDDKVSVG